MEIVLYVLCAFVCVVDDVLLTEWFVGLGEVVEGLLQVVYL